ncbi:MAG: DUF2634 domain-containing protein [Acetatifactor sp.]|nr:DUF2634 domain-containing protein [Acetatifactor sp.]
MIPNNGDYEDFDDESDDDLSEDFEMETEPSLTYAMNLDRGIFTGRVDDIEAIMQAVTKIISTERYEHEIYSWDYGIELADLRGQSMPYVMSEVKRRITEALTADDRIESVEDFEIKRIDKNKLHIKFTTVTAQGDEFKTESEVGV